jgi:hypothetical protein
MTKSAIRCGAAPRRVVVQPLSWADVDFPSWTWAFEMTREFRQDFGLGESLPPGYGIAWHDYERDTVVCMPVPVAAVVGAVRFAWRWLKFPPWRRGVYRDQCEARVAVAYRIGEALYSSGYAAGVAAADAKYNAGYADGKRDIAIAALSAIERVMAVPS